MKYVPLVTLISALFVVCSAAFSAESPLPAIQSTYVDEVGGTERIIHGTGFLLDDDGTLFAVTAGHVSQGGDTTVLLGDKPAEILGRLADNAVDLEILEVPKNAGTPLVKKSNSVFRQLSVDKNILDSVQGVFVAPFAMALTPPGLKSMPTGKLDFFSEALGGEVLVSNVKVVPGMSGAAVLKNETPEGSAPPLFGGYNQINLVGVVTSFLRDFDRSYIVPAGKVLALIKKYKEGKRGTIGSARWGMRAGNTYKRYSKKLAEIPNDLRLAGSAETADGGNAETADGSDVQGSRPLAGVEYEGKRVTHFLMKDKVANEVIPVYGNSAGALLPEMFPDRYELVRAFTVDEPLKVIGEDWHRLHLPLDAGSKPSRVVNLLTAEISKLYTSSCLTRSHSFAKDMIEVKTDQISLKILGCGGDVFRFDFDRQGRVIGQEDLGFQPVLNLKGEKTGKTYTLDIKNLFFVDALKATDLAEYRFNKSSANEDFFRKLRTNSHHATIQLREPFSGAEVSLEFSPFDYSDMVSLFQKSDHGYIWDELLTAPPTTPTYPGLPRQTLPYPVESTKLN